MGSEFRYTPGWTVPKVKMTVEGDGSKATMTRKSGLDCSAGEADHLWLTGDLAEVSLRHLEDMTEKYPDICHMILSLLTRPLPSNPAGFPSNASQPTDTVLDLLKIQKINSFIMDAEVVAIDKDTGAYRTFQDLSNRAKKDVRVEDIKVVVGVFAFDLMLLNDHVSTVSLACFHELTADPLSHSSALHSPIADTCSGRCSHRLPIRPTSRSHGSVMSNRSIPPPALTYLRRCRRFSRLWSSRNVRD